MFVELIEALRCPMAHEETPLVASAARVEARHIVDGVLGCPVCAAEFTITNRVARFGGPPSIPSGAPGSAETAMRLAAFLALTDARGFALLFGRWASHADEIRRLSDTSLVLVNPPSDATRDVAGVLLIQESLPFAEGSARAAALDAGVSAATARSAARAVRVGGRVLGPVSLEPPGGTMEVARDGELWIAERQAPPDARTPLIPIERARR